MSLLPPRITSPEAAQQAGYKAGQQIQKKDLSRRELVQRAIQQAASDGVPMTLFSDYRDSLIEGYTGRAQ